MTAPRANLAAALLVAALLVGFGIPATLHFAAGRGGEPVGIDAPSYVRIARTLLRTGSLVLPGPDRIDTNTQYHPEAGWGTPWALAKDGRLLPKHSWAFGLLLVPGVALGDATGAMVEAILLGALLGAFVTWRAARAFGPIPAAAAAVALLLLSPAGSEQIGGINIEIVLAATLVGAFACAAEGLPLAAGLCAGLAPMFRPTAPLLFLALPLVLHRRSGRAGLLRALLGFALGLVPFAVANTWAFGAPWITPYHRAAAFRDGRFHVESHTAAFGANVLEGLRSLLASPDGGLVFAAPVALIALLGYLLPGVANGERLGGTAGALAAFLSMASYTYVVGHPGAAYRFGFPLVVTSVAPLAAMLGFVLARSRRR